MQGVLFISETCLGNRPTRLFENSALQVGPILASLGSSQITGLGLAAPILKALVLEPCAIKLCCFIPFPCLARGDPFALSAPSASAMGVTVVYLLNYYLGTCVVFLLRLQASVPRLWTW